MAVVLPKFGLKVPSETTRFAQLGKELREMGVSLEQILDTFDYTGKDPNLVLSRVANIEAWRATAEQRIATLEAFQKVMGKTPWVSLRSLVTPTAAFATSIDDLYLRRNGDAVEIDGRIVNGTAYTSWAAINATPLPKMYWPRQGSIIGAAANSTAVRSIEFAIDGGIRGYSNVASGAWWGLAGRKYFTDEPLP